MLLFSDLLHMIVHLVLHGNLYHMSILRIVLYLHLLLSQNYMHSQMFHYLYTILQMLNLLYLVLDLVHLLYFHDLHSVLLLYFIHYD